MKSIVRFAPASSTKVTTPMFGVTSSMVASLDLPASRSAQTFTARTSPQKSMSLDVKGTRRARARSRRA
jgi:hypothetical protein